MAAVSVSYVAELLVLGGAGQGKRLLERVQGFQAHPHTRSEGSRRSIQHIKLYLKPDICSLWGQVR